MRLISWDIDTGQFRSRTLKRRSSSGAACSLALLPGEDPVVLLGASDGLVRAMSLPEATRGHDAKRCGDGVRVRSALRT